MLFLVSKLVTGFASTGVLVEPHRDGEVATRRLVLAHEHRLQAEQAARAPEQRRRGDTSARLHLAMAAASSRCTCLECLRMGSCGWAEAQARAGSGQEGGGGGLRGGRGCVSGRAAGAARAGGRARRRRRAPAPAGGGFRTHACARSLSQETFREKRTNRQSIANLGVSERSKKTPHPHEKGKTLRDNTRHWRASYPYACSPCSQQRTGAHTVYQLLRSHGMQVRSERALPQQSARSWCTPRLRISWWPRDRPRSRCTCRRHRTQCRSRTAEGPFRR